MKKIITIFLLCAILSTIIIYKIFAFITWQLNPINWSENTRFSFVILESLILIISGIITYEFKKIKKL